MLSKLPFFEALNPALLFRHVQTADKRKSLYIYISQYFLLLGLLQHEFGPAGSLQVVSNMKNESVYTPGRKKTRLWAKLQPFLMSSFPWQFPYSLSFPVV